MIVPLGNGTVVATVSTVAVAVGLSQDNAYFEALSESLENKRNRLAAGLEAIGFKILPTEGTYFLSVDIRSVGFIGGDIAFCETLTRNAGVAAIPLSAFYQSGDVNHFARFCFSKQDSILDAAIDKLGAFFQNR